MAMHWNLPVIFVIENNGYAMGTSVKRTTNVREMYKIGESYEMPSASVDGMKPERVHEAIAMAAERARKGEGPTLLEIRTYRYRGHSMSDPAKYRTKEEVEAYKKQDPIEQVKATLLKKGFATEADLETLENNINEIVADSVEFSENSPWPEASDLYEHIYAEPGYPFIKE